jgi:SAM-dependent methyltransferase
MDMDFTGESSPSTEAVWEQYFSREGQTFFQRLLMFHRRVFISRAVRYWFDKVFPKSGCYVEAGAGTSEGSGRIRSESRTLVALDVCYYVLRELNILPHKAQGDILHLPFGDASLDGIWNMGVMEHFSDRDLTMILCEFRRTLKPEGSVLLFWPPWFAPYEIILDALALVMRELFGRHATFFPDEINRYRSRTWLRRLLAEAGFGLRFTSFGWRDLFSYVVVVADIRQPSTGQLRGI